MPRPRADRTLVWAVCGLGLSAAALAAGLSEACAATAAPRDAFGQPDFGYGDRVTVTPDAGMPGNARTNEDAKLATASNGPNGQDKQN